MTTTVQGWLSGAFANHGFLIKRRTEPVNSSGPMLPSDRFSNTTLRPMLELTYHQNGGILLRPETLHAKATVYSATTSLWQEWGPYTSTPTVLRVYRMTRPWLEGSGWGDCTGDGATW